MLGLSQKKSRAELLREKHTALSKEFSSYVQERVLDAGHRVEALARPILEHRLGMELFPATMSFGRLSASCDGLTMMGDVAFEHKLSNEPMVRFIEQTGQVPPEHMPQCQQVLLVTGAERLIFVMSDGTPDKFIQVEVLPDAHRLKVPLISVWGSADLITDHNHRPSYSFRVSLKDDWGVEAMMRRLATSYKVSQACAFLPNTAWGRSADAVIKSKAARHKINFGVVRWYNWGDTSFAEAYRSCLDNQGQGLMFVGNEKEASILLKEMAAMPAQQRLPVVAHWGTVGGVLHQMVGDALGQVSFDVIQTFTFIQNQRPRARTLAQWIHANSPYKTADAIPSPVGAAHAYDAVHLVALAVERARSTEGSRVRDALEKLPAFSGAVRDYKVPFTATRHDAFDATQVLFVRVGSDGSLTPIP